MTGDLEWSDSLASRAVRCLDFSNPPQQLRSWIPPQLRGYPGACHFSVVCRWQHLEVNK